jgi:hypothetical protein
LLESGKVGQKKQKNGVTRLVSQFPKTTTRLFSKHFLLLLLLYYYNTSYRREKCLNVSPGDEVIPWGGGEAIVHSSVVLTSPLGAKLQPWGELILKKNWPPVTLKSFLDPELAPLDPLGRVRADLVHHRQVLDRLDAGVDDLAKLANLGPMLWIWNYFHRKYGIIFTENIGIKK